MKILYSQLVKLIPNLKANALEVAQILTMTGFMMDGYEEVVYQGDPDYLMSFEIRQNRADCLSVIGLAYEVAAYYGLKVELPVANPLPEKNENLKINVSAVDKVKRVTAVKISGLKNGASPDWLKEYLAFYDLNSISLLVDLSNYVMLLTGYPSHLIDLKKISGELNWAINDQFKDMTTLDGTKVDLKNGEIIISDDENIIALAGIVGGQAAEIDQDTTEIIAEVAVYDRSIIRQNSRQLHITTEASQRLEKDLDPNGAIFSLQLLVGYIQEFAGGQIASSTFDYYPSKYVSPVIEFDSTKPGIVAGIAITDEDCLKIFSNLDFAVKKDNKKYLVTPPTRRVDLSIQEDLNEDVIRLFGYDKVPSNEMPKLEIVQKITPQKLVLTEKIKDFMVAQSFDEILSWPLTKLGDNKKTNYFDWQEIKTQNSVNEEYPYLRQSIGVGLFNQLSEYLKKNVEFIKIFEIGKVFGKTDIYKEHDSLGLLIHHHGQVEKLEDARVLLEKMLRHIGFDKINYQETNVKPELANPFNCWDVIGQDNKIGVFYKAKPINKDQSVYLIELNVDKMTETLLETHLNPIIELTEKLIVLDVNIELPQQDTIDNYINHLKQKEGSQNIFNISITDKFPLEGKYKYTLRVAYKNVTDREAKELHLGIFNL